MVNKPIWLKKSAFAEASADKGGQSKKEAVLADSLLPT